MAEGLGYGVMRCVAVYFGKWISHCQRSELSTSSGYRHLYIQEGGIGFPKPKGSYSLQMYVSFNFCLLKKCLDNISNSSMTASFPIPFNSISNYHSKLHGLTF